MIFEGDLRKIFGARPFATEEPAETKKTKGETTEETTVEKTVEKPESKDSEIA